MTLLVTPTFYIVIAVIAIVVVILVIPSRVYAYFKSKPTAKEREEYAKAIQEGMNEVDVDFYIKHPRAHYKCPYSIEDRSCKDPNCPDGYIDCKNCDWYGDGVKPSKF